MSNESSCTIVPPIALQLSVATAATAPISVECVAMVDITPCFSNRSSAPSDMSPVFDRPNGNVKILVPPYWTVG